MVDAVTLYLALATLASSGNDKVRPGRDSRTYLEAYRRQGHGPGADGQRRYAQCQEPSQAPQQNELRVFAPRCRRKRSVGPTRGGGPVGLRQYGDFKLGALE